MALDIPFDEEFEDVENPTTKALMQNIEQQVTSHAFFFFFAASFTFNQICNDR